VRPIDALGITIGALTGGAGLWLLGFVDLVSAWRGAGVGAVVVALFFAGRTGSTSIGYFGQSVSARYLAIGAALSALGALAGYIGGRLVRRDPRLRVGADRDG
jgi:hypothetical protein